MFCSDPDLCCEKVGYGAESEENLDSVPYFICIRKKKSEPHPYLKKVLIRFRVFEKVDLMLTVYVLL